MKILYTFSGKEYILDDEEAQRIVALKRSESKAFIELRCGAYVDTSAIESVSEPPLVPMFNGYVVHKGGYYFHDGYKNYLDTWRDVEWLPDPRYKNIANVKFKITEGKNLLPENPQEGGRRSGQVKKLIDIASEKYGK